MKSLKTALLIAVVGAWACGDAGIDEITAAGVVDGEIVTIKAAVAGRVETSILEEGSLTEKGVVLVAVNSDKLNNQRSGLNIKQREISTNRAKLESRLQMLKSTRSYWTAQVSRLERLRRSEAVSGDELERARLKLEEVESTETETRQSLRLLNVQTDSLRNQHEHLDLLLEDHETASPVSGIILERFITEGENVFPGTPLADILDRDSLYVEVFLEGIEISRIRIGQGVSIQADGVEDRDFSGAVASISDKAEFSPKYIVSEKERGSLLYRVKITIPGESRVFKLGMPVTVKFDTD